ncbi:MAG: tRNA 2-thiocytidine(32) synthetase TtcA [Clostridia bacterium]|nr:tRNA 2-thiocytidine(32) synthetase TtcA [Clostridia bacterium]MCI8980023.1 tRNA 2-thiocytidine(32) synthetase TtcA [Clostridia bacterium]MCI9086114.1 tRNA 2-thiocytidine(32) synthetase TtcA [Clostridia bacterium]NDO19184.1 tRNA 2-thiocytidine(32) synthetase TtcA [Lachnospiraceae bacterium MD329]
MKKVVSLTRRAIEEYNMIEDGDKIAVGVSGGKDSLVLLCALAELSRYYPKKFTVTALTLDMGYKSDYSKIQALCDSLGVEFKVKYTNIKEIVFDIRNETNPCSLCAKMRRGSLNDFAIENGCRKVALGHHNDDVLETFLLSLMHEGRIHCFSPVTYLDRTQIYQIRPMIYVRERDIRGAARNHDIPVIHNECPADGYTQREYMKDLIKRLEKEMTPGLRKRLFRAIHDSSIDGWNITDD